GRGQRVVVFDVWRLAVGEDLALQVVLHRFLQPGIDVEDHGVADLRRRARQRAHHVALRIDRERLAAVDAPQVRLVLRLYTDLAHDAGLGVSGLRVGLELVGRDIAR